MLCISLIIMCSLILGVTYTSHRCYKILVHSELNHPGKVEDFYYWHDGALMKAHTWPRICGEMYSINNPNFPNKNWYALVPWLPYDHNKDRSVMPDVLRENERLFQTQAEAEQWVAGYCPSVGWWMQEHY